MALPVKGIFRYISGIFHSIFRFFIRYISGIFRVERDFGKVYFGIFRVYFIVYFGVLQGYISKGGGQTCFQVGLSARKISSWLKTGPPPLVTSCPMQACARVLGMCA